LLVADACSGLNSISSLLALALVYAHVTPPRSPMRMGALLTAIIPIAMVSNVARVTALVLVTVHWGEQAAEGAVHALAGLLAFVLALALLVQLDGVLRHRGFFTASGAAPAELARTQLSRVRRAPPYIAAGAMLAAAIVAPALKPVPATAAID